MSRRLDAASVSKELFNSSDSDNSPQQSKSPPKKATVVDALGNCYKVNEYHLKINQENVNAPFKRAVVNLRGGSKEVTVIAAGSKYLLSKTKFSCVKYIAFC